MIKKITLLIAISIAVFTTNKSWSQTITSSADDGTTPGTLRVEIANATPGSTLTFDPSITNITLLLGEILIDKDLTISGVSGTTSTIDANSTSRVFNITSGAIILENLTLTNGVANDGGAIYMSNASVTINNSFLTSNTANGASGSGGAIFNDVGGVLVVNNSGITANIANRAGGGIEDNSGAGLGITLINVNLDNNNAGTSPATAAPGNGGGLHITGAGDSNITGGTVMGNIAAKEGGGLWNGSGTMMVSTVDVSENLAVGNATGGGGLFNNGGTLTVDAMTTLTRNIAMGDTPGGRGGAMFNNLGGTLNLANGLTISGNYASRAGGAIEDASNGLLILDGVTLIGNAAGVDIGLGNTIMPNPGNGGALHLSGTTNATISNLSMIENNLAAREGGGLWNNLGTMTLTMTSVDNNIAYGDAADDGGGGIFNNGGTLTINSSSQVLNNQAIGISGSGGGIFSTDGVVTVNDSWVAYNTSNRAGGGIEAIDGIVDLSNVTLDFNTTGSAPGNGGGLHITGMADTNISGGTVTENTATREGGGLWNGSGIMTVNGTLITGNIANGPAADDGGGGIFNNGGTLLVHNSTTISSNIADGAAGSGGGILTIGGNVTINESAITSNQANRAGGGIELAGGTLNLINAILDMNNAGVSPAIAAPGSGGGLHVSGPATTNITGGTTNGNIAANEGGGLWNGSGVMTVVNHTIDGNTASGNDAMTAGAAGGGGIYNEGGTLDLSGSTIIINNSADGAQSTGGGILNAAGTLTANGITIMDNQSNRAGGGIETNGGGAVMLTNVNLNSNDTGVVTGAGAPGNGGALHVSGNSTVDVTGGTVNMNTAASEGGGLWNGSGIMTVAGTTLDSNMALGANADNGGGALFNNGGTLIVQNGAIITNNMATGASGSGGGIQNVDGGILTIIDSEISGNTSNRAGGGIEDNSTNAVGTLTLTNVILNNNSTGSAPGNGGGLHNTGPGNSTITGGTVNGNMATREGGGLWNGSGVMTLDAVTIDSNIAQGDAADDGGAGVFNNGGTLNITNGSLISNNISSGTSASGGGLLSTAGNVTVSDSSFETNAANRAGGAIEIIDGTLTFTNSIMSGNDVNGLAGTAAPGNGGGLHVTGMSGVVTISTSTISNNAAANEGGGLWNQNGTTMSVSMSTIDNNTADEGGGIYNNTGSITSVMTTTISGNSATVSGGGLSNNGASLDLNAVTVVMNTAALGGGIDAVNNVSLKNTIVALNTASSGMDVSGTIISNDYNLIGLDDLNAFTPQANDLEGVNPLVGPLQDNGGTTLTHQLLDNSPAFDAGDGTDVFVDQIGQPVFGSSRDLGALESQTSLSIDDFNQTATFRVYPNPTDGNFKINLGAISDRNISLMIVSITGQVVKKATLNSGLNTIDMTGMASGMYMLNIRTTNNTVTHKLILQ
ncbi:beta strand repeat-containing protein [Bizionia hallyeonensis]|uniref:Beta strand repeat-containing protein n=1 Tax=Bizionia hallyeonensis TaxID=1123757 RepID=A0ABW0C630_9FLAO